MNGKIRNAGMSGMSLVELMVGLVVSAIVLGGAYRLWRTHQEEGDRLGKKIDLRNQMTLSAKRIQRSVTLAGLGLGGAANLSKEDAVGSDTLIIFTNMGEGKSGLLSDILASGGTAIQVASPGLFAGVSYLALGSNGSGEVRKIVARSGSVLELDAPLSRNYPRDSAWAYPAARERYYTDQEKRNLIHEVRGATAAVAKAVMNFQVSFRDMHGASTMNAKEIRTVQFSFTGIYPAKVGALNSIVFSSTAIPRNTL